MTSPKRVMIVAWGSRGDLQPVTSLALCLKKASRDVLVFATPPATDLIQANGIDCVVAKENVEEFVENMFGRADLSDRSIGGFIKLANFAKEYLNSPDYVATQKADMKRALAAAQNFKPDVLVVPNLIYGPFMCIAEALQIPVVTFDLQVNHPTSEFPLFTMEVGKVPKFFNRSLYRIKALVYPKTIKPKFDMMREICGLPLDTYTDGSRFKVWPHNLPQTCAVSPSLCPQPADWPAQKFMSGWWFLSGGSDYTPPPELVDFLKHRPVYIGFGSMKGNPEFCKMLSTLAIKSLQLAGIRAGCPTIVCATQGDQPFHGSIAQARGIGRYLGMVGSPKLTAESIAAGIKEVTTDQAIVATARTLGEQVRAEDGVANAISFIYKMATSFSYPWPIKNEP